MKKSSRFQITSKQLIFVIIGTMIGTGVLSLPRAVTEEAEQDGWIVVILGALPILVSLFLIERLCRRFPNMTIVEMSKLLFGKIIGAILTLGFIAYVIAILSVIIRIFTEITSVFLLSNTPIPVIIFLIVSSNAYIVSKGVKVVARLDEILFYILLVELVVILPSLFSSQYTNILPVGGSGIKTILSATLTTTYFYAGIEILFVIYPMITHKKNVIKSSALGIAIVSMIYLVVTVVCLLVFGTESIQNIIWPTITLLKGQDIPVLERLEVFFLAAWMGLATRPILNYSFTAVLAIVELLKLDKEKHYSKAVIALNTTVYFLALIQEDIFSAFKYSTYVGNVFLAVALVYPIIFHIAAFLRKGKVKKHE